MAEWTQSDAYVINITRPNSLTHVLYNYRFTFEFKKDPPRLEAFESPSNDLGMDKTGRANCKRRVYYFGTHAKKTYEYGRLCTTEYGSTDGTGYYRDVKPDGIATLVRYNPVTKRRAELFRGELEYLFWVASDERYAVVILDDNGKVNCLPGYEWYWLDYCQIAHPKIAVIDLKQDAVLYSIETTAWFTQNAPIFYRDAVRQVDQKTILLRFSQKDRGLFILFSLSDLKATALPIQGELVGKITPDGKLMIMPDKSLSPALNLYVLATGQTIPLVNAVDGYVTAIEELDGTLLRLTIAPSREEGLPEGRRAQYVIELPR